MRRHLGIGAVDRGFVEAGFADAGLEIVADDLSRHAADGRQGVDVHGDPVRQGLAPRRLGVDEARSTENGDEDFRALCFSGRPVDHLHRVTGKVDEQPVACRVHLTQRRFQPPHPGAIQIAEPRVAEPVGGLGPIFIP